MKLFKLGINYSYLYNIAYKANSIALASKSFA